MAELFEALVNMTITGSIVIVVIILVRFLLKGMPKKYSYILWVVAGFRLCCPFSFKSIVSIFNINPIQAPSEIVTNNGTMNYIGTPTAIRPDVAQGIPVGAIGGADGPTQVYVASGAFDIFIDFIPWIWLGGFVALLIYALFSFIKLKKSLATATKYDGNIYQSDAISSPFILGIIKPKIYIPYGVESEYFEYVIAHEKYHLKRFDNIIKVFAFLVLALHWFNPLCWVAFTLMNKDMEMSCDEWVLSHNDNIKKQYSSALLSFATNRHFPSPSPLCFGEDSAKSRIKNVLKFKKPTVIISVLAIIVCAIIAVICIANPKSDNNSIEKNIDGSDIVHMNIGSEMPKIIYADDNKIIFNGTAGIITYDYNNDKITDRISWNDIDKLKWSDNDDYRGIASVSENGKTIYFTEVTFDNKSHYNYAYDTNKNKFKSLGENEIKEQLFVPESINAYEGEYVKYIDTAYLTSDNGARLDNTLLYLRANTDWSMQSLQLVICDLSTDNDINAIDIFKRVTAKYVVQELNNDIMDIIEVSKYLSRATYIDEIITETITGVEYVGDSGSGLYRYDFKYNDICFTITSISRDISGLMGITYTVDGQEYASCDEKGKLVFNAEFNAEKQEEISELFMNMADESKKNDYSDVIADISSKPTKNKYYKALMEDKDNTIRYIFGKFCQGRCVNANGTLMRIVMDDIIGDEAIKSACDTGQEYFDLWAEHNEELLAKNDNMFMKQNYPYGYIYLTQYASNKLKPESAHFLEFFAYCCYDVSFSENDATAVFEYDNDSSCEPKVFWQQNYYDPEIKEASLMVVDGYQEIYIKKLDVEDIKPYSYNNDKWDYVIELDQKITARIDPKLSSIPGLFVVIRDSNDTEYRIQIDKYLRDVELAPVFVYNNDKKTASYHLPE